MYFYIDCLQKTGKFALLWMGAFEHTDFKKRSIQLMVKRCDVQRSCDDILKYTIEGRENCPKMNLYVTGNLLAGLAKIFREKAVLTLRDSAHLFIKWGEIARSLSVRDVTTRGLGEEHDPEELPGSSSSVYLHKNHHAESAVELYKAGAARKQNHSEDVQQAKILDAGELFERLRDADSFPQDITMTEVPPPREVLPDEGFGGAGTEDLAPFVREALREVRVETLQPSGMVVPEVVETVDIPVPTLEKVVTIQADAPTIEVHKSRDASEVDMEQLLSEIFAAEVPVQDKVERQEIEGREERQRKARDSTLEFSLDKIKQRFFNFQNLMRQSDPRKDERKPVKSTVTPDWQIPDMLKAISQLFPPIVWPPASPKYKIKLAVLQQNISQIQEVEEDSMEVEQIRDGEHTGDMHLRPYIGTPTPTAPPREGRVRATPSPSPIGKGVQRTSAELNIGDVLEPIAETAVLDSSALLNMDVDIVQEPQVHPQEKDQDKLLEETRPLPRKRPRRETDSDPQSSVETVIIGSNEDRMRSLIAVVLKCKETVTFGDIAPRNTTSKLTAARLFSTLLDLEMRKVLVTQQEEPYGPINIHLVQPVP